jgi:uncharacterized protein YndB with AHSA1/START domain
VFEAWTRPELFQRWWVPKSAGLTLLSCHLDVRVGGTYRLVFRVGEQEMAFFGRYLDVVPSARIVWTNEEAGPERESVSTVTFEEKDGKTLVVMRELHPSKAALDETIATGASSGNVETFEQLEDFIAEMVAKGGPS